nr:EOG090X01LQ [Ilyocryptus agilis]
MLPSVGYFKSIICPFFENGACERPYCQFRHEHLPVKIPPTQKAAPKGEGEKSAAIEQIVSEAVKKVLKENGQLLENFDAVKIMELVGQQKLVVEHLAVPPKKPEVIQKSSKGHKTYHIPTGTPAYTPTPLAVLEKSKPAVSRVENYVPVDNIPRNVATYKPSKMTSNIIDGYCPSGGSSTTPDVNYTPSSADMDAAISDRYTPSPNNSDGELADYKPTNKEFSSVEPSYSPSCSTTGHGVDYSPSSITSLSVEPTYSPAQGQNSFTANYTPSSLASCPLSPEKYLELLENDSDESEKKKVIKEEQSSQKRSKEKDEKRRNEKEKSKRKKKDKEKERSSSKSKSPKQSSSKSSSSSSRKDKSTESKSSSRESKSTRKDKHSSDSDSDEMDVHEECYRIFKEYQPSEKDGHADESKKRKSEESLAAAVEPPVVPVKKQRIAHVSTNEAAPSRPAAPQKPPPRLSPAMLMLERYKKLQEAKAAATVVANAVPPTCSSSSSRLSSLSTPSCSEPKKRIAHVPNVSSLLAPKPKSIASSTQQPGPSAPVQQRQQQQQKFPGNGALNSPANKVSPLVPKLPRPIIAVEFGCRVPANVRQKYLNVLVDETLKIYDREEDAYQRAVEEEKSAYSKCSSKVVYVNVITNLVQRIRREVESGSSKAVTNQSTDRKIMSHSAMLAGKGGATVSWSIEKPRNGNKIDSSLLKGVALYKLLERHVLTVEQQEYFGYPRPDPTEKGKAVVNTANKFRAKPGASLNMGPDQRLCDRCGTMYKINSKGMAVKEDDVCSYHWGKQFTRRGETRYTCCKGEVNSDGCSVAKWHISDMISAENLRKGFVRTMMKPEPADGNHGVFALDCEMCYTTEGPELTRVTVVDTDCRTVYETLVKPDNPILDYNTRFSGISEEDLTNVKTTIRDVQAVLLSKFSDRTILIGHSFESDLCALKVIHNAVIDTSVVFPHPRGLPYKKALRTLCADILQKIIQNDVGGHDSAEDAIACMELMMWKVKQELKQIK